MADTPKQKGKPEKIRIEEVLDEDSDLCPDIADVEVLDSGMPEDDATDAPRIDSSAREPERRPAGADVDEEVQAAQSERDKYHDLWIRSRADLDNYRKRVEREAERERTQAGAALVRDILPVLDNLERAIEAVPPESPVKDGIVLIERQLRESLTRAGLEPIEAVGRPFDPLFHEAVMTEVRGDAPPNTVIHEAQRGYLFRGRVLRPTLVSVAVAAQSGTASAVSVNESDAQGGAQTSGDEGSEKDRTRR